MKKKKRSINYPRIKKLCKLQEVARKQIMSTLEENEIPNTKFLNSFIKQLEKLFKSKSKKADFTELKNDLEWIKEYYAQRSWWDVTRWLTNIDSSLREFWSDYINAIKGNNEPIVYEPISKIPVIRDEYFANEGSNEQ